MEIDDTAQGVRHSDSFKKLSKKNLSSVHFGVQGSTPEEPLRKEALAENRAGLDTCWHIPIIAALAMLAASVAKQNSGFFYVGLMEVFNVTQSDASWPNSVASVLTHFSGILLWVLKLRFSANQIAIIGSIFAWAGIVASAYAPNISWTTITLGAIYGAGQGLVTISLSFINMLYFDRYRGIASGLKYAGLYSASLIFPPALVYFEESYGFRGTLLLIGAITMHATAFSIPLKSPPWMRQETEHRRNIKPLGDFPIVRKCVPEDGHPTRNPSEQKISKGAEAAREALELLKMPVHYLIVAYVVISDFASISFQTTIVDYSIDKGFPLETAESVVVYSSAAQLVGSLIVPLAADCGFMLRSTLITVNFFVFGFSLLVLPQVAAYACIVTCCFCVATSSAFLTAIRAAIVADYLGVDALPVSSTLGALFSLPLFMCNPMMIGAFRESMGSYDNYYRIHGGLQIFAGLMFSTVRCYDKHHCKSWTPK